MASGSPTDPSTQCRPSQATGGPASSGIDALACSATRQSATDVMPVSVWAVRSAVSVATRCIDAGVRPSLSQSSGLRWPQDLVEQQRQVHHRDGRSGAAACR